MPITSYNDSNGRRRWRIDEDPSLEQPIYSDGILSQINANESSYTSLSDETEPDLNYNVSEVPDTEFLLENIEVTSERISIDNAWSNTILEYYRALKKSIFYDDGELGQYQRKYDCISIIVKDYTVEDFEELEKMLIENDLL